MIRISYDFNNGLRFDYLNFSDSILKIRDKIKSIATDESIPCADPLSAEVAELASKHFKKDFEFIGKDGKKCSQSDFYRIFQFPFREVELIRAELNTADGCPYFDDDAD